MRRIPKIAAGENMNIGDWGELVYPDGAYVPGLKIGQPITARVSQVISDTEMIVSVTWKNIGPEPWNPSITFPEFTFWVLGVPTKGLVDDKEITLGDVYVVGTKKYATVLGGSKTVFTFTVLTKQQIDDRIKARTGK
jgi:hypothetical protein